MTFVQAFYSFKLEITNSDSGGYYTLRIKIPRHPEEPLVYMYARVLAFAHSYEEGLEFTKGFFDTKEPALWKRDLIGGTTLAIEVGEIEPEKIRKMVKHRPPPRCILYFYSPDHIEKFCHGMRGSTTNWISDIKFYEIPSGFLEELTVHDRSSSEWSFTFIDNTLYLTVNGVQHETTLSTLDMWEKFQETLNEK